MIVLWMIGLISLIALAMITATHYRLKAAANTIEAVKAAYLGEAGIALAKLDLMHELGGTAEKAAHPRKFFTGASKPAFCMMPTGAVAAILIEDEGGKIDLNLAPPEVVALMLRGLDVPNDEAVRVAQNIRQFATVIPEKREVQNAGRAIPGDIFGPKHGPFDTPLELDQVEGMTPGLFKELLPYVTVTSRRPGIDPRYAPPALLAALQRAPVRTVADLARKPRTTAELARQSSGSTDASLPVEYVTSSSRNSFLIDVEIITPGGGYFSREVVVEWLGANEGLRIQEWRRGRGRFDLILRDLIEGLHTGRGPAWPSC